MKILLCILEWILVVLTSIITIGITIIAFLAGLICAVVSITYSKVINVLKKWRM